MPWDIKVDFEDLKLKKEVYHQYLALKTEYCPECGGEMVYDLDLKLYTCKSCGLTLRYHEIIEMRKNMKLTI